MKWQKRARIGIALFVAAFLVVVVLAVRRPQPPATDPDTIELTDKAARSEITGGLVVYNWGEGYRLRADTERLYDDGRVVYTGATLELPDRGGRQVTIRADEVTALVKGTDVGEARFRGNVRLATDDGLELQAAEGTYDQAEGLLRLPGAVSFRRGRLSGTGTGATYDETRDVVWLLADARIEVAPDASGDGALRSTSGSAGLARGDHYARLTRGARVVGPGREAEAEDITIRMTADNERLEKLELRVNSRITGTGAAQSMAARDIDLHYAEDGRTLRTAALVDTAVVQLTGEGGSRRVSGRTIDIELGPDGETVTALRAAEAVQVDLPAQGGEPQRRIRAHTLEASGPAGIGLQAATFTGNVEFRETAPAGRGQAAMERTARSARLVVGTAANFGTIEQADFRGQVEISDAPDLSARAPRILYQVARDRLDLSPGDGEPGPEPEVTDGRVHVKARTIELALGTRGMRAETDVRSTIRPQRRETAPKPGAAQRLPAMLKDDEPVFVTANTLAYDGAGSRATYTGNARLWQDETRIQAETIVLDDERGNLSAEGSVRTTMQMTEVDPRTKQRRRTPTEGRSQVFVYDDATRMATYTRDARITGAQGDMQADRIEVFLSEGSNDLERLEAYDRVTVREGPRVARGTRLTYTTGDERYVMTGGPGAPVVIVENKPSGCDKHISPEVTFFRATEHAVMQTPTSQPCSPEDRRLFGPVKGGPAGLPGVRR